MRASRGKRQTRAGRVPLPILALLGVLALAVVYRLMTPGTPTAVHPEPRPDVTAEGVVPAARYSAAQDVASVYAMAEEIPAVLDGLHCYCDCARHFGHRSLLTCFESDHGANCDICMNEVRIAYRLHKQGKTLDDIRTQIDAAMSG